MSEAIQHVIVLMLENRSFDHMLGYMDYPEFRPYRLSGRESNPRHDGRPVRVSMNADHTLKVDPGHKHKNVMAQIKDANQGFVKDYANEISGRVSAAAQPDESMVMRCFNPMTDTRVLATLAREFAVLPHWHCSVPGATWPNRFYAHAATSAGWVDNPPVRRMPGLLPDRTIFQQLDESSSNADWKIYCEGSMYQAIGLKYVVENRRKVKWLRELYKDIKCDELTSYSFVEPVHWRWNNSSQHPYYIRQNDQAFARGEALIANIYSALRAKRDVFNKTLFLITYDEHGGFFDRRDPPDAIAPDDQSQSAG